MLEEFKNEDIVNKVGGRFKLSSLIQKRLVALNRGTRPLVEISSKNPMEIVVAEIMQDKIFLDRSGNLATVKEGATPADEAARSDAGPSLDDL